MPDENLVPSQPIAVAYEAAVGILDDLIGYAATRIDREQHQPAPDPAVIASWRQRRDEWAVRRADLRVTDIQAVQAVLDEDGAVLRSLPRD